MIRTALLIAALSMPFSAAADEERPDIWVLGEIHDNPAHHLKQAEIIRDAKPTAVVFEMLTPEQATILKAGPRGDPAKIGERINWAASGWPDYALYQPVFEALGEVPVIGAARPRTQVRRAFSDGAAAAFGADAARFHLDQPVPETQLEVRKQMQFEAHCEAMPMEMMDGMVEAQRFRDAAFADATLTTLQTYGAPVILIAGNGHARVDWGVPAMIGFAAPDVMVQSVGMVEGDAVADHSLYDTAIATTSVPPETRGNPCAAFGG